MLHIKYIAHQSILLLLGGHSFTLHTGRAGADVCLHAENLLLTDGAVRDLSHTLKMPPVANLLVEELIEVQAEHLRFFADAQVHAGNVFEDEQQDARDNERVGRDCSDLGELLANLHAVAVDTAGSGGRPIESADLLVGKDAGEERSHHSTDTVKLEDVEAFVDVQPVVEILKRSTSDSCEEADDSCEPDRYVASGGSDTDEASDCTFAGADNGEMSLGADVVDDDPTDSTSRSGNVGVKCGVPINHVSYRLDV